MMSNLKVRMYVFVDDSLSIQGKGFVVGQLGSLKNHLLLSL